MVNLLKLDIFVEFIKGLNMTVSVTNDFNETLYVNPAIMWFPLSTKNQLKVVGPLKFVCDKQKHTGISQVVEIPASKTVSHSSFIDKCTQEKMIAGAYNFTYDAEISFCKTPDFRYCDFESLQASTEFVLGETLGNEVLGH